MYFFFDDLCFFIFSFLALYRGGDVNFIRNDKATDGKSVLHEAAEQGSIDMCRWLLSKNADINIRTTIKKSTPLILAAKNGHLKTVMLLLKKGAVHRINDVDSQGMSALHFVAATGTSDLAQVLLICGADKNIMSKENRLPLDEAKSRNRVEMIVTLQKYRPVLSMREERMIYFENIYQHSDEEDEPEEGMVEATSTAASVN